MAQLVNTAATSGNKLAPAAAVSRHVEANGLRLHYLDYGGPADRPVMLCVHGGAANGHWYDYVAPSFVADYRVLAIDLRGHGDSQWTDPPAYAYEDYASDLSQVVERLDLRDFVLVGHSMGGAVSLTYAANYPGRVSKLVIVDTSIRLAAERIAKLRDVGSRPGTRYATREDLVSKYRLRPGNALAPLEVQRHIAAHSARRTDDGAWIYKFDRNVYAIREIMDGLPLWGRIRIPALLVKGDRSERISPEIYADVKARCPQAERVEVAESDHHVTLDNPAGFVQAVKPFLARHR